MLGRLEASATSLDVVLVAGRRWLPVSATHHATDGQDSFASRGTGSDQVGLILGFLHEGSNHPGFYASGSCFSEACMVRLSTLIILPQRWLQLNLRRVHNPKP